MLNMCLVSTQYWFVRRESVVLLDVAPIISEACWLWVITWYRPLLLIRKYGTGQCLNY